MHAREAAQAQTEEVVLGRVVALASVRFRFNGVLALPLATAWRSAAVLVSEGPEVDESTVDIARRLAAAGHAALAIGHDGTGRGTEAFERIAERVDAALSYLVAESRAPVPRFGVVGFGPGGFSAIVAGYRCRAGAAVCLYGDGPLRLREELAQLIDQPKRHAARFLFLLGGEDATVKPGDVGPIRDQLEAFGMRNTFIIYPRTKGAFCRPGPDFRAPAAEDAWLRILLALDTAPRLRHRFSRKAAASVVVRSPPPPAKPGPPTARKRAR
jgi:dienelactone hydrolase